MLLNVSTFIQNFQLELFIKIIFLIFIGLYAIFTFMLATKIRSLNKIVFLPQSSGAILIQIFAILYFLVVLSLFFFTLVIV